MTMALTERAAAGEARPAHRYALALRIALRELRAGLGGFYVFIACIALGVAVIAAVNALSDGLTAGFREQGREILGGDFQASRIHQRASEAERAWFAANGRASETATLRAMARTTDGREQALIELKGVDGAYPLVGRLALDGAGEATSLLHGPTGGALVEKLLLERLGLELGDTIRLGTLDVPVRGILTGEPDGLGDRMTFGPRVMVATPRMMETGLVQPGTLIRWRYAMVLDEAGADPAALAATRQAFERANPEGGFILRDHRDPAPQITRTLDRLRQFLSLLGLTALIVGGVGVANAVATFIDKRRRTIATLKSLGASGATVLAIVLAQVLMIASVGIAIGLIVGYALPPLIGALSAAALPIELRFAIEAPSVVLASLYGVLVALLFTLWPLGRAQAIKPAVLFREDAGSEQTWPSRWILAALVVTALLLVALAVLSSDQRWLALALCAAVPVVLGVFAALGQLITMAARRLPRPRSPELRIALGNLAAPGGLTRSVVLSLGLGLSLLVTVALTDASIVRELTGRLPDRSPAYFVLDIPRGDVERFQGIVDRQAPGAEVRLAPMLRGRLVRLNGTPVEQIKAPPEAQWVLNGDRGLTYADAVPDGSKVVAGAWWDPGYAGEPLVSFEADLARNLKVGIGDTVTVNVLGRNITARIANLREVQWESLAINFVMVFSPNTLRGAPHNSLATITLGEGTGLAREVDLARALGRDMPSVTPIRVKDAIAAFTSVFERVMTAVRVAGSVTLAAGALVLAGALMTAQRRRIQQAVVLRTLGASRRRILVSHLLEYAILAALTAGLAVMLGAVAAWLTVTQVLDIGFVLSWSAIAAALGLALMLVMAFGAFGTSRVLTARPVPILRQE